MDAGINRFGDGSVCGVVGDASSAMASNCSGLDLSSVSVLCQPFADCFLGVAGLLRHFVARLDAESYEASPSSGLPFAHFEVVSPGCLQSSLLSVLDNGSREVVLFAPVISKHELSGLRECLARVISHGVKIYWLASSGASCLEEQCSGLAGMRVVRTVNQWQGAELILFGESGESCLASPGFDFGHPGLWPYVWYGVDLLLSCTAGGRFSSIFGGEFLRQVGCVPFRLSERGSRLAHFYPALGFPLLSLGNEEAVDVKRRLVALSGSGLDILVSGPVGSGREAAARLLHGLGGKGSRDLRVWDCARSDSRFRGEELSSYLGDDWLFLNIDQLSFESQLELAGLLCNRVQELRARLGKVSGRGPGGVAGVPRIFSTALSSGPDFAAGLCPELCYRLWQAELVLPGLGRLCPEPADIWSVGSYLAYRLASLRGGVGGPGPALSILEERALDLCSHAWPGNYLELWQWLSRLLYLPGASGRLGGVYDGPSEPATSFPGQDGAAREGPGLPARLEEVVRRYVREADQSRGGLSRSDLARRLGISRGTLYRYLRS